MYFLSAWNEGEVERMDDAYVVVSLSDVPRCRYSLRMIAVVVLSGLILLWSAYFEIALAYCKYYRFPSNSNSATNHTFKHTSVVCHSEHNTETCTLVFKSHSDIG